MAKSRADLEKDLKKLQGQYNTERKILEARNTGPLRRELALTRLAKLKPRIEAVARELDSRWA